MSTLEIPSDIFWWHSIDLGNGVTTSGVKTPQILQAELASLQLPDLRDKTVLDIGAWDGFYSFEAEKRGAARVVSLDHFVWSLDVTESFNDWEKTKGQSLKPKRVEDSSLWHPDTLPGKRGYDLAHAALSSCAEPVVGDFMKMDLEALGSFDVTFFLGILYHMENPLGALQRLASVTNELAIIETHAVHIPGFEDVALCEFYPSKELNHDNTNWFGLNSKALVGMCQAAGFSRVSLLVDATIAPSASIPSLPRRVNRAIKNISPIPPEISYYRAVVQAWK